MSKKIMVVDDEAPIREAMKAMFEAEGLKVLTAASGPECLEKLKNEQVDLVLLDFFMPGMNGREVLEKIREDPTLKFLKVAIRTVAQFGEVGKKKLRKLNIADYIAKPFDNSDLIRRVKRLIK